MSRAWPFVAIVVLILAIALAPYVACRWGRRRP